MRIAKLKSSRGEEDQRDLDLLQRVATRDRVAFEALFAKDLWQQLAAHPDTRPHMTDTGFVETLQKLRRSKGGTAQDRSHLAMKDPRVMQARRTRTSTAAPPAPTVPPSERPLSLAPWRVPAARGAGDHRAGQRVHWRRHAHDGGGA